MLKDNLTGKFKVKNGKKDRGFTLVELIVVLAILAILAVAGGFAAIGYIRTSKFNQNTQNAITVYQTAQASISRMMSDGTLDSWTQGIKEATGNDLFDDTSISQLGTDQVSDQSIHRRIALTYNPQSADSAEDAYLYDMLSGYFYDKTVFAGTISLELDISATYGSGQINYSANVMSAFYSRENSAETKWDSQCIGSGYSDEFNYLPQAKGDDGYIYRSRTSLVGWFNGTAESVSFPAGLSPVFLPQATVVPLDGHILAGNETGYLFNLRNGETLDLAWAIFDEAGTQHEYHKEDLVFSLIKADEGNDINDSLYGEVKLKIDHNKLEAFIDSVSSNQSTVTNECISVYNVTRTSREGFIDVEVTRTENGKEVTRSVKFPITITEVKGDGRTGTPRDENGEAAPYYEFRLTLDGMMERADETTITGAYSNPDRRWNHFSIDRLFGYSYDSTEEADRATPRNIYATMLGSWEYTSANNTTQTHTIDPTKPTEAARAMDDPVYLTNVDVKNGQLTYFYTVIGGMGRFDWDDFYNEVTGKPITGRCVVNSLFGDYSYEQGSDNSAEGRIAGTYWTSSGGNAVITSYRHLYNIRKIDKNKNADFRVVRSIDWYVHDTAVVNNEAEEFYASEVRVFSVSGASKSFSPVVNGELKVVSFPAIFKIYAKHTLSSMSSASGKICSINNIQLRTASFRNNTDNGYGLICQNLGAVYNIYTNNLNLVLADVADGSASDYTGGSVNNKSICPDGGVVFEANGSALLNKDDDRSVGGLIGRNSGKLGLAELTDDVNTISMRNAVVMAGQYWKAAAYPRTSGVIGFYDGSSTSCGVIELRGSFAVVGGGSNTAGILGDAKANVGARLVVDGNTTKEKSEYILPVSSNTGNRMKCVLAGSGLVAGGIAGFENVSLNYGTAFDSSNVTVDQSTGEITFPGRNNDFQIDVTIPENGLFIKFGDSNDHPIAGAIAQWVSGKGEFANIRIRNNGYIVATSVSKNLSVGGAVGVEKDSKVKDIYIDVENGIGSRVGSLVDNSGPLCAGGVYGWIQDQGTNSVGRNITINAVNDGMVVSRGSNNGEGSGGAIGGATDTFQAKLIISVINQSYSQIIGVGNDISNGNGVGGAIGGFGNLNANGNCKIPAGSIIYVDNKGTLSGKYHVGGAIGNAPAISDDTKIYTVNSGRIIGVDFVGGAVGRCLYAYYGSIQSILDGAVISGVNFIGGAAGRLHGFQDGASVKVIVNSDSSVEGSGSIVGGACGDVNVQGSNGGDGGMIELAGINSAPELIVEGGSSSECVGGVVGILRANRTNRLSVKGPDQSAINKLIIEVDGGNSVGGVLGKLRSSSNNYNDNSPNSVSNNSLTKQDIYVTISTVLHPQSYIKGNGSYVGGAIGFIDSNDGLYRGRIDISSATGNHDEDSSFISGASFVGGAVGRVGKSDPRDSDGGPVGINVDFSASPWTIIGTMDNVDGDYANVGGAVGCFDNYATNKETYTTIGWANSFPITVNLGNSTVCSTGMNVGGAIGWNLLRNGSVSVVMAGTVSGKGNVGGAIGCNRADLNSVSVSILGTGRVIGGDISDVDTDSPELSDTKDYRGTNVGGAIGFNHSAIAEGITVTIDGEVFGYGNNVGGAIGICFATNNSHKVDGVVKVLWIKIIDVTLRGTAKVRSESNSVGGALGYTLGSIETLNVNITGKSGVSGYWRVGGAIGLASCIHQTDNRASRSGAGVILNSRVVVSADNALEGVKKVGGVVGQVSFKNSAGWTYAVFGTVTAELNASTLFDPDKTGPDDPNEDAMVGGMFGLFSDGSLGNAVLTGTGGTVDIEVPDRTYANTVLIKAKGRSVGGIAGQIGGDGLDAATFISTVTLGEEGHVFPYLCVVSVNGADRIGGWFGSTHGQYGGLGNREKVTTYNVSNVRVVYSTGKSVGALCGYTNLDHSSANRKIYADINVTLDEASIIGGAEVGGAIGSFGCGILERGGIHVSLTNHTNIGDIAGNTLPGDTSTYTPMCVEAGGAIGYVYGRSNRNGEINVPVTVTIDATSRIAGLAESADPELPFVDAGVGGAFGRFNGTAHNNALVKVVAEDLNVVSVYSAHANVGGCIGVLSGEFTNNKKQMSFANQHSAGVSVRGDGDDVGVGGFIGRMDSDTSYGVKNCNYSGSVISTGQRTWAGGFTGYMRTGKISYSYTTAEVRSNGSFTGGFIGGTGNSGEMYVEYNYVGGHTYEGQYLAEEGNITGTNDVGGFIGMIGGDVRIKNCYTTASVLGTGANIGGFVGNYAVANGFIDSCYSTGRVNGPEVEDTEEDGTVYYRPADTVGSFAGFTMELNSNRYKNTNRVMTTINSGKMYLVGSVNGTTGVIPGNGQIVASDQSVIHSGSPVAHPYDSSLLANSVSDSTAFPLRAVINSEHYGDWPNPVPDGKDLAEADIILSKTEFEYVPLGVTVGENLSVYHGGQLLVEGTDYTLSYVNNDRAGTARVIIAAKAGSGYIGSKSMNFTITRAVLTEENTVVSLPEKEYEYTVAPITPDNISVSFGDLTLRQNVDYYLTYSRGEDDTSGFDVLDHKNLGVIHVSVHGMGNYQGDILDVGTFTIKGSNLENAEVTLTNSVAMVYTGELITPGVVVRAGGRTLVEGEDYEVEYADNLHAGTDSASVTINGKGSYSGTITKKFSILQATNRWDINLSIDNWTYGEANKEPAGKTHFGDVAFAYFKDESCTIPAAGDDPLVVPSDAGSYWLRAYVVATADFTGAEQRVRFTINRADISLASVTVEPSVYKYTGESVTPSEVIVEYSGIILVAGRDYTISYPENRTDAGTVTFTITGIGNYMNITSGTYRIENYYTVTFDSQGGSDIEPQEIINGGNAVEPQDKPIRDGFEFDCWCSDAAGNYPFVFSETAITKDITLYAKWIPVYTVTFDTQGGPEIASQDIIGEGYAEEPGEEPVWEGRLFSGWYKDQECTEGNEYDFAATVTDDIVIYAKWITVSFDTGNEDIVIVPQFSNADGAVVVIKPEDPVWTGHTFIGWYKEPEYAEEYEFDTPVTSDVIIYAKWEEQE
ncbi:MAG: InlB B-repeat-containing protein [Saccharofermentans sp.]|nr:InlB B-repeat-containing protein [Saccharofermentans sp.]